MAIEVTGTDEMPIQVMEANEIMFKVLPIDDEKARVHEILYEKSRDFASCSCKQFDSSGIPCNHLLAYLHKIHQFHILPDEYILKRWIKSAKCSVTVDNSNVEISVDKSVLERRGTLFQQYSHLIDKVILNDEASKLFCEAMDVVNEKIKPFVGGTNENVEPLATKGDVECRAKRKSIVDDVGFLEPDPIKTKGSGKRLKRGKEKGKMQEEG
ncbi:protein FAR1-RELATED SEQUENCE 9-like [Pyrus x bretschneideri]|uniref:protein FAR1-RELATED SEQUENCE 9-like n=1 Tax=Pyrus x bretschneideri TaxID=225117 RepID=UPI00202FB450|nr:protein FAR1-RELATED SEQUENCE 9-like [Pyrus x bretschneideri]